jgi:hypothetical protein
LDNTNFIVAGEGEFDSTHLYDIDDDMNPGVICADDKDMPSAEDYGDMHTNERPKDDDEEAMDNYLNVKLIMNMGTNDKRCGRVVKRSRGLEDGEPIS